MPGWVAKLATAWVIVAVVSSAVLTCVPGAMSVHEARMPACASMHEPGAAIAADRPATCCVRHEPSLTAAKIDLRQRPVERAAPAEFVTFGSIAATAVAPRADTPAGLTSTLGPPVYITLSTLRI